jgi:hypothetical protein
MWHLKMDFVVPEALYDISGQLQKPISEVDDAVAYYLADAYRSFIVAVGAVDTGELLFAVHVEEGPSGGGISTKYVVADVDHAAVVEIGWTERAAGQASYPGRYPAQKAVEYTLEQLNSGRIVDALEWRLGRR